MTKKGVVDLPDDIIEKIWSKVRLSFGDKRGQAQVGCKGTFSRCEACSDEIKLIADEYEEFAASEDEE